MKSSRGNHFRVRLRLKSLVPLIAFLAFSIPVVTAQTDEPENSTAARESVEVEVPIIASVSSRQPGFGYCGLSIRTVGPVVTEEEFAQLISASSEKSASYNSARCAFLRRLNVDFTRHSLLTYGVNGDCFVRAKAAVFRDDSNKKYIVRVTRFYGGCRAAGSFEGWLVIDKLQPGYEVRVEVRQSDEER